jgi:hypothetical protein
MSSPLRVLSIIITVFLICLISTEALAVRGQEESLRGLNGFMVEVEIITDLLADGLVKKQIESEVATQLKSADIKVYSQKELNTIAGRPYLFIEISGKKIQDNWKFYTYSITVHLYQEAYLAREPQSIAFQAATWFRGYTGHGYLDDIRVRVKEIISIFVNTYLSVNSN